MLHCYVLVWLSESNDRSLSNEAGGYVSNFMGSADVKESHHLIAGNKRCVDIILKDIIKDSVV